MTTFVDPRTDPSPPATVARELAAHADDVAELVQFCKAGRVYDVERWLQAGRPVQVSLEVPRKGQRKRSALEVSIECRNHALELLLLCNGYDQNHEVENPLDLALRTRQWDLVDLLLEWGADPHRVDLEDFFGTYRSELFERFWELGVNLTADHALAEALGYHTRNKPLFGFAKRHREQDPTIQAELNIALAHHASEGNAKGVYLSLWAGADPHAPTICLRYPDLAEEEDEDSCCSAVYEACLNGDKVILEQLGPDPSRDDYDALYRAARGEGIIELLARSALPRNVGAVIESQLSWMTFSMLDWGSTSAIRLLFEKGARWDSDTNEQIGVIRRHMLKMSDYRFVDVVRLFAEDDYCSSDVLKELGRTPSIRTRMKKVGFIPSEADRSGRYHRPRPPRSKEVLAKFGIELPKPKKAKSKEQEHSEGSIGLPHTVEIGLRRPNGREVRLDRAALFELVWSKPVMELAAEWGLSDRGLGKACRRLKIPVPPRGHWARVKVGQRRRRPKLPQLKPGEAAEIVIWAPE